MKSNQNDQTNADLFFKDLTECKIFYKYGFKARFFFLKINMFNAFL